MPMPAPKSLMATKRAIINSKEPKIMAMVLLWCKLIARACE